MHSTQVLDAHGQEFAVLNGLNCELADQVEVIHVYFVENVFNEDVVFFCGDNKIYFSKIIAFSYGNVNNVCLKWKDKPSHSFLDKIYFNYLIGFII